MPANISSDNEIAQREDKKPNTEKTHSAAVMESRTYALSR